MNGRELLAWNLRKLRVERGLAQDKLAADAGVDRAYVGNIERQVVNPTIDLVDRLCAALAVDFADLFRRPEPSELPPKTIRPGPSKPAS
ncbi:helix-turn-helix domain-containing protein [Aureimonas leprariae]|uniref:Helix-turn-helix transcriptional regulator n=1 Tax=Plantimonas leprariae TaxID=2615207 RepID=A0A7V7TXG6_9HYPH|nr:helix-turn-helix transcriptional regulator [Aureimonas leprariae]KAB0681326.1 helix-turn-helix transcriptional regulator [Aureimonas leprariae]